MSEPPRCAGVVWGQITSIRMLRWATFLSSWRGSPLTMNQSRSPLVGTLPESADGLGLPHPQMVAYATIFK